MRRAALASLLLALTAPALAQDVYDVTGPDLVGRAELTRVSCRTDGSEEVRVALTVRRFGKKGAEQALEGPGVIAKDGTLTWSYRAPDGRHSIADWLRNPAWGSAPMRPKTSTFESTLRPADGALKGLVEPLGGLTWRAAFDARGYVVLAVPGLSTNQWNRVGIPYLDENLEALRTRGFEGRRLEVKTEDSVATNAAFIAREVRIEAARGRRVIIMAHSKGGTDTTAALALYPDLRSMVAGVIAIQPVYNGSPVADLVASNRALTGATRLVFEKAFNGELGAVLDLTHEARKAFVAAHPYPVSEVPTVVIRSTFDRRFPSKSVLFANQKLIERVVGEGSDGMVTLADQRIPGAVHVTLTDLDHFEPGVRVESPHSPVEVTNLGLAKLLPLLGRAKRPTASGATVPFDRALGED